MKDQFNHLCDTDGCLKTPIWRELTTPDWNDNKNPEWCEECKQYREHHRPNIKFERIES